MEIVPLISLPALYLLVAWLKPYLQQKAPFNICAVCIAVLATWFVLLGLWFAGFDVAPNAIGILIGMTIVGGMYRLESTYQKARLKNFWFVRLVIILGGFYATEQLLARNWSPFILILIMSILSIIIVTVFFQGVTHQKVIDEQAKKGRNSSLMKRLDDCC